jgi:CDP-glucose 4,6-dehydratase
VTSNLKPDIIFHLAAQPLVLPSYQNPRETFEVNFDGTLNILEIIKENKVKSSIIVTTDKVYKNENKLKYFKETDALNGTDPYSSSKVAAEKLVECYNENYFSNQNINVVTARAGNVIGGGDRSEYRIIPDFFKALRSKKTLKVRFPDAIRPWQHVLDPLYGYLLLAKKCYQEKDIKYKSWNFSHYNKKNIKVKELILKLNYFFNIELKFNIKLNNFKEKKFLNLSSNRSKNNLNWKAIYNTNKSIQKIIEWELFFKKYKKIDIISKKQITDYLNNIK